MKKRSYRRRKLSDEDVKAIREAYGDGTGPTMQELGDRYGVTRVSIWQVIHRRTHVG